MKREIVTLLGRVQGVGYRERVLQIAREYAVAGSVRNLRAGSLLEIDVEGDDAEVDAFVGAVQTRRPFLARIDIVHRQPAEPRGAVDFEMRATA
jgi:hydrogenase maturation factor HypF (carbamoyltransferase family)